MMAADELSDYLENGNITHSVNYPDVSAPRTTSCRVCVLHRNIPNMLGALASRISAEGINIEAMVNKSRGAYAYTLMDIASCPGEETALALAATHGVIRVRIL